jgi:hypothetical protein
VSFISRQTGFEGRLMVVFTPDRIFEWSSGTGGPAVLDEEKPQAGGRSGVPAGPPVLSEIHPMIGINPARIIKSRPGSLSGKAFFSRVLDRLSGW